MIVQNIDIEVIGSKVVNNVFDSPLNRTMYSIAIKHDNKVECFVDYDKTKLSKHELLDALKCIVRDAMSICNIGLSVSDLYISYEHMAKDWEERLAGIKITIRRFIITPIRSDQNHCYLI